MRSVLTLMSLAVLGLSFSAQAETKHGAAMRALQSPKAETRLGAVIQLKQWTRSLPEVRDALIQHIERTGVTANEKWEAFKSLSDGSLQSAKVRQLLMRYSRSSSKFAAIATKALYQSPGVVTSVRSYLVDVLRSGQKAEKRAAAAWALHKINSDTRVRNLLLDTALSRSESSVVRIEALESLYGALHVDATERKRVIKVMMTESENFSVRIKAARLLQKYNRQSEVRAAFRKLTSSRSSSRAAKQLRFAAMAPLTVREAYEFHDHRWDVIHRE